MRVATRRLRAFLRAGQRPARPRLVGAAPRGAPLARRRARPRPRPRRPARAPERRGRVARRGRAGGPEAPAQRSSVSAEPPGASCSPRSTASGTSRSSRRSKGPVATDRRRAVARGDPRRRAPTAAQGRPRARPRTRRTTTCTRCGSRSSAPATPPSSRARQAYVKAAKSLQDVLGEHQDAVVAEERLRALVDAAARRPRWPPGGCSNASGRGRSRPRDEWEAAWKRLAKTA